MKTLITSILTAIVLFFNSSPAKAETNSARNATADNAINWYIASVTKGQTEEIADLLSNNFSQNVTGKEGHVRFDKAQVVDFLQGHQNIQQQNCATSYSLVEEHADFVLAKVEMKYGNFTKVDYVSLSRDDESWKINQVNTVYP